MTIKIKSPKPQVKCFKKEKLSTRKITEKNSLRNKFFQAALKNKEYTKKLRRKKEHLIFKKYRREKDRKKLSLYTKMIFSWMQLIFLTEPQVAKQCLKSAEKIL